MITNTNMKGAIVATVWIALVASGCGQTDKHSETEPAAPVFARVPSSESGVAFRNDLDENYDNYFDLFAYVYNGAGVGMGDINNDGLPDLYFTGNQVANKLYLNKGGLKFEDITASAGVAGTGKWNNGVTMVDINADRLLDIYVCKGGWHETPDQRRNLLFVNQGDLTFKEQAKDFGLDETGYSIHASFFDMDNDNDLDAYVTNRPDSFDLPLTEMVRQKKLTPSLSRDKLLVNVDGKFKEIGLKAGITNNFGYALSVVTSDLNNDGYTDIFVANDFAESDYMYINQKNGTFKEQIQQTTNHISMYSMGADVADINNDGLEDIMVTEMLPDDYQRSKVSMPSMDIEGFFNLVNSGMHKQYMHNVLHLNQGNNFFGDVSQLSGVTKTDWSWACLLSDFDNDGDRDIFVANGYKRDVFDGDVHHRLSAFVRANMAKYPTPEDLMQKGFKDFINLYTPIKVVNYAFENKGGLEFTNSSKNWGFNDPSFSNGAATGDLDNDGDLDLVINNIDDEAFVYQNTSSSVSNYLRLRLTGPPANAFGIGAKVTLFHQGTTQYFENKTVRGYLSSNDPTVHFGLGQRTGVDSVLVRWTDGKENALKNIQANQLLTVEWKDAIARPRRAVEAPFINAATDLVSPAFVHRENEVNEYKEQILLPHGFTKSGPFIATADVDNDGNEDFFVGGAAGQSGALYIQGDGKFVQKKTPAFELDKSLEDAGVVFFDVDNDRDADLYVASGGSEFPDGSAKYNDRIYLNDGKGNFSKGVLPPTRSSGSCVLAFDADGDGDQDVFRGGQVVPGAYPKVPRSYLLINEDGNLIDKTRELAPLLQEPGMVRSAAAADLNGDKKAELILVGEWMPIRIFSPTNGRIEEVTTGYIDSHTEGWWNTVTVEDLDGDGDADLLAGNLGENYKFRASEEKPFQVYAKDFDKNGTNDVFLARYLPDSTLVPIRGRECTSQQMPALAQKFPTFGSFASSDLSGILGREMENALHYKAHMFSSVMLINDGGKLTIRRLPVEAQLSTVNGFIVSDFNNDGKKDILLAGNKFDVEVETTPADASVGLFLEGGGDLNFTPWKASESGFFVPYNVKAIQPIKTPGGWSVLVAVNDGELRVFNVKPPQRGQLASR